MISALISPLTRGAYFQEALEVAEAELLALYPEVTHERVIRGALSFINLDLPISEAPNIARLSWVQALFEPLEGGALRPLEVEASYELPDALVWGSKYRGKTNELVTQLALNLAISYGAPAPSGKRGALLDPMAGRGTTLLWAARYGLDGYGVERERDALEHFQRDVKRQTKLHKIKHKEQKGVVGHKKSPLGRFFELTWAEPGCRTRLIQGESERVEELTTQKRFQYIVSDLPYGVQFTERGGARSPLASLKTCAPAWADRLVSGGAMVLIFNALQPKREELIEVFEGVGLTAQPFTAPHRMSESIARDLLVFVKAP